MRLLLPRVSRLRLTPLLAVLLFAAGIDAQAQSTDARFPTPVAASEIVESIAARDIGDSRLTDYFYTFTGLPGDLLVTVESKNLNGDIDIFTAGELRPLLKVTFYAESITPSTKNIYLRKRQSLILRIEARTPNDDSGTYRIRFAGAFEPTRGNPLNAESEKPPENSKDSGKVSDRKTTRVSSVGARIDEPVEEVAAAPAPKPTPKPKPTPSPEVETAKAKQPPKDSTKPTPRTARTRRPTPRKPAPKPPAQTDTPTNGEKDAAKDAAKNQPVVPATNKPDEAASAADKSTGEAATKPESGKDKPAPYRRPATRRAPPPRKPARTPVTQPESTPRLVIEQKDGTRREFLMSNVRKVTVENGEILVENYEGVSQRISMAQVARMSIGP